MTTIPTVLSALMAIWITGCATPYRIQMPQAAQEQVHSAAVVLVVPQQEIYADFEKAESGAATAQYGLVGALVAIALDSAYNTYQSRKAEELIAPVRDALIDYKLPQQLKSQVDKHLAELPWLHARSARIESALTKETIDLLISQSDDGALLLMEVDYHLTPGLKEFKLTSNVTIYPVDDELKATAREHNPEEKVPLLYKNRFVFLSPYPDDYSSAGASAMTWSADQGSVTRLAMKQGILEVSRMLVLDLSAAKAAADAESNESIDLPEGEKVKYGGHTGTLVEETSERVIIRIADGELYSVVK